MCVWKICGVALKCAPDIDGILKKIQPQTLTARPPETNGWLEDSKVVSTHLWNTPLNLYQKAKE